MTICGGKIYIYIYFRCKKKKSLEYIVKTSSEQDYLLQQEMIRGWSMQQQVHTAPWCLWKVGSWLPGPPKGQSLLWPLLQDSEITRGCGGLEKCRKQQSVSSWTRKVGRWRSVGPDPSRPFAVGLAVTSKQPCPWWLALLFWTFLGPWKNLDVAKIVSWCFASLSDNDHKGQILSALPLKSC